ncbi:MAG: coagulation factor 5/8 type protein [Flaviaesturariibacter sp.]|nr:coagulation factor 5/8 type protein [Flaviaesturariibacter sp.]
MKHELMIPFFGWMLLLGCSKPVSSPAPPTSSPIAMHRVDVSTATELKAALETALPGDEIVLADGHYEGRFVIQPNADGIAARKITLRGSRNAILDGGSTSTGYVLHLQADYWILKGFTITNGLKGLMLDGASYNQVDSIRVHGIGEEGIHLRTFSSHNLLTRIDVTNTGLHTADYGEGIYIGSAKSNWATYTNGQPDLCDANEVRQCHVGPGISAECIDIKEGTTGGFIRNNLFDATGITGANSADSWIDVKGNNYLIEGNTGTNPAGSLLVDGYQVHVAVGGWGNNNEFRSNTCAVNAAGYGFLIKLTSSSGTATGNKVYSDNLVTGAASGVANIPLTN